MVSISTVKRGGNDGGRGGEMAGVASASGRRRGGWGGGQAWRRAGARARGGSSGLLGEGELERTARPGGPAQKVGPGFREGEKEKEKENQFRN
jgi:hypothetical protein